MDTKNIKAAIDTFLDEKVSGLEKKHKIAICAATVLLPFVAFYFLSFSPRSEETAALEKEVAKLERQLRTARKKAAKLDEHKALMRDMEIKFKEAAIVIPDTKEIPSLLTSISSEGTGAGLDIVSFKPKAEKAKEFYARIPVSLSVVGTYHNFGYFLDSISKLPRIVNVTSFSLGSPKSSEGEMLLKAKVQLVTYKFIDEKKKKKKGKKKGGKK